MKPEDLIREEFGFERHAKKIRAERARAAWWSVPKPPSAIPIWIAMLVAALILVSMLLMD